MDDDLNLMVSALDEGSKYVFKFAVKIKHGLNAPEWNRDADTTLPEKLETLRAILPPHIRDIGPLVDAWEIGDVVTVSYAG